jgi:segregation and condensation protein B
MELQALKRIVEAALLVAGEPVPLERLLTLFEPEAAPSERELREALAALRADYQGRGMELVEVASGWRVQVRQELAPWVGRLWQERPPRYGRALLETLALIAYRQPITRGEIEEVRGVAVATSIIRTLLERGWVRVVGHREVPGRPALYATTRAFLDYFNLQSLSQLPTLAEVQALLPETDADEVAQRPPPQESTSAHEHEPSATVVEAQDALDLA